MPPQTLLNSHTYIAETTVSAAYDGDAIEVDGNERHGFAYELGGTLAGTPTVEQSWNGSTWADSGATFTNGFANVRGLFAPLVRFALGSVTGSGSLTVYHSTSNER